MQMTTKNKNLNGNSSILFQAVIGLFGTTTIFFAGCAICCGPFDYHYPTFGGSVQRSDPVNGRIGSIYSDPGPFGGPSADYNLKPHNVNERSGTSDDGFDDLEPLDDDDELTSPDELEDFDGSDNRNGDLLPPPADDVQEPRTPSPDESTSIRRLRNQSQRPTRQWR